jgi:hypothetical protein
MMYNELMKATANVKLIPFSFMYIFFSPLYYRAL